MRFMITKNSHAQSYLPINKTSHSSFGRYQSSNQVKIFANIQSRPRFGTDFKTKLKLAKIVNDRPM